MKLSSALSILCSASFAVDHGASALRPPTVRDVADVYNLIIAEIEASTCPADPASVDYHAHWDRDGLSGLAVTNPSQLDATDCVLYPRSRGPRSMGAKLVRLGHADAAGRPDGFVNIADRANNGGIESAAFALDAMYDAGILLDSSGERIDDVISKADFYAWAGAFGAEYMASFARFERDDADGTDLPSFGLKWGRKTYVPKDDADRGPIETFVPASSGWDGVVHYFATKFDLDERQSVTLMGAHSLGSAGFVTAPPFVGYWTSMPEAFDSQYYDMVSNPVPLAVDCADPFDPSTCETLSGCSPHYEAPHADASLLKSAATREEDGGDRCHGWEQIPTERGGHQWAHSCDMNGNGCSGILLNVDASMQYDIDHHVDSTTGKVTSLPEDSVCGEYAEGMRVFIRCFKTREDSSSSSSSSATTDPISQKVALDHRNDPAGFLKEFAGVYDLMMTNGAEFEDGKGLYDIGEMGSFEGFCPDEMSDCGGGDGGVTPPLLSANEDLPNNSRCPLDSVAEGGKDNHGCYWGPDDGNPFLCIQCHSGVCGMDEGDQYPMCRDQGWKPTSDNPPMPAGPKQAPPGAVDDVDTLNECPIDNSDLNSGCRFKLGSTSNPFVCFHCKSNICGLDLQGNFLCRPEGWSAKHAALPASSPVAPESHFSGPNPGIGAVPPAQIANLRPCPLQSTDAYKDCFQSAANPFSCHACESNACGVGKKDGKALCRPDWWCPDDDDLLSRPPGGNEGGGGGGDAASYRPAGDEDGKVRLEGRCPYQMDDPNGDCFLNEERNNPFLCNGCFSGACGVDHYGDARCREPGWNPADLVIGEMCPQECLSENGPAAAAAGGEGRDRTTAPFECAACQTNYCGVNHFGDGRCVEPSWRLHGIEAGGLCPFETEGCLFNRPSGWPCDACESNLCAVNEDGDARCEDASAASSASGTSSLSSSSMSMTEACGGSLGETPPGEFCELNESSPDGSTCYYDGKANPFTCCDCTTGMCGVTANEEAVCVESTWTAGQSAPATATGPPPPLIKVGQVCNLNESGEGSGCYYDGSKNPFLCRTCESGVCGVNGDKMAVCVDVGWKPDHMGIAPGTQGTAKATVPAGELCDLDESGGSGCNYDGKTNPFTCLTCETGVCGVNGYQDAVCVDVGWQPDQPGVGAPKTPEPSATKVALGQLCNLDESEKGSGCYYDGSKNPFTCLTCETGVCGVNGKEDAVCVDVGWQPDQPGVGAPKTPEPSATKVALGKLCDLNESGKGSGCFYDGSKNPFTCLTCETGVCGVDGKEDAVCVEVGWKPDRGDDAPPPPPSPVKVGELCDLDESGKGSGCYYDGSKNPFTCLTCETGVCGVDSKDDAVCVEVSWQPNPETALPDASKVELGHLCDLDESDSNSGCYYDGSKNPFTCLSCATGVCGVDDAEEALCVDVGWTPNQGVPIAKLAKWMECPVSVGDPASGCYYSDQGTNPFLCIACESGVCGVDHFGKALCRETGWVNDDLQMGDICPFQKDGCRFSSDGPNPWHCVACKSGFCGEDKNGDAKCVAKEWKRKQLQVGDVCPFKHDGCLFTGDGQEPWPCDHCESGWCNINSYGDAKCYKHSPDTPPDEFEVMPDEDFCPLHQDGCQVSHDTPNPWPCKFCQSGSCGEDSEGNAQCRNSQWTPPKQKDGEYCPMKRNGCLAQEVGSEPFFCDACESGWCKINSFEESICVQHSTGTVEDSRLGSLSDGTFCAYHQEECHVSDDTPNPWSCKFCKSGICGEDSAGNAMCRSNGWSAPKIMDGSSCPIRREGCSFGPSPTSMTWSCDACKSGACAEDSYGNSKCVKHGDFEPKVTALEEGEFCPHSQEGCLMSDGSSDPWPCKFCRSGVCGKGADADAQCRSKGWVPPAPTPAQSPGLSPQDAVSIGSQDLDIGELCPFEKGGCLFLPEGTNPWTCTSCASGFCGEDHYGDAKCVRNDWEKVDLKVDERCPLNLIDQDSGCFYDKDEIGRLFLCEACATNMCGIDSKGDALCRDKGWKPPQVRGRARLSSVLV